MRNMNILNFSHPKSLLDVSSFKQSIFELRRHFHSTGSSQALFEVVQVNTSWSEYQWSHLRRTCTRTPNPSPGRCQASRCGTILILSYDSGNISPKSCDAKRDSYGPAYAEITTEIRRVRRGIFLAPFLLILTPLMEKDVSELDISFRSTGFMSLVISHSSVKLHNCACSAGLSVIR